MKNMQHHIAQIKGRKLSGGMKIALLFPTAWEYAASQQQLCTELPPG